MTTGIRNANDFCWINILTPKPAVAREFFAKVLGWSYAEIPGVGHLIRVAGRDVGGIFDNVSPRTPQGAEPIVGVMLKVDEVDALAKRVRSLGGRAETPFDIGDSGRMSVCHDSCGAEFDVWQPNKMRGTDVDSALHGAPCWFELMTNDVDRAMNFYSGLFGWTIADVSTPEFDYSTFRLGATPVAGMLAITPSMGAMQPHWRTYFRVSDADRAASTAVELGGKLTMTMKKVPGGKFCEITSPHGVVFCVTESTR